MKKIVRYRRNNICAPKINQKLLKASDPDSIFTNFSIADNDFLYDAIYNEKYQIELKIKELIETNDIEKINMLNDVKKSILTEKIVEDDSEFVLSDTYKDKIVTFYQSSDGRLIFLDQMNMNMRMPPRHYMIPRPMMNMGMGMNMGMALRQTISADFNTDEARFYAVCADPSLIFNPARLGFIPPNLWEDRNMTFGECVSEFFQRKNNANSRFSHKLFNALRLSEFNPIFTPFVGVKWINENILRVDKRAFARLLGIKSIDGSLFHQQGNFPSHGFFEIGAGDVSRYCPPGLDLTGVDFENVRLLIHTANLFKRGCTEADIEHCRWASTRK